MAEDLDMRDDDEDAQHEELQVHAQEKDLTEAELDEKYPNRPINHGSTLPFHDLFEQLFDPLNNAKRKPSGPALARRKVGRHGPAQYNPHEARRHIIEAFISRWRQQVGNDIFPAFRLIVPDKDRDRPMYGMKEKAIAKLLVRITRIDKNSADAHSLMNWKLPGKNTSLGLAGDFAARCHEVLSKRALRTEVGDMTIEEVNDKLDQLAFAQREEFQLPIMEQFYNRMNADEIMWLIRIILRQMKIGATERTFFSLWHPDAERLYNVSSNLRRVCWELYDPKIRLDGGDTEVSLMQCFQPQLAQFQYSSFDKMIQKLRPTETDPVFWIEEKLDGERMQLHMRTDDTGKKEFAFWSRKAKDYTYLYGNSLDDSNSALTRHLKDAFDENVRNIILDGEMITWDPERDKILPFGTLKTAALDQQKNPYSKEARPLLRVFDILYLNDTVITRYTLRDRRNALEQAVKSVPRRLEIHTYKEAQEASEIEPLLRKIIAESSEGLVVKNPRSMYRLNQRNDDWIKVKPEYMTGHGEAFDCCVIGGYYGSGRRGGMLSSFLCGVRVDQALIDKGADPRKFLSFCKVGGGMNGYDYTSIRHNTEGKWHNWDPKNPPKDLIELAGGEKQLERPDVWIDPKDSVVLAIKGASLGPTEQFKTKVTLRFPRFKQLRSDKDWSSALTVSELRDIKANIEEEEQGQKFTVEEARRKRARVDTKMELRVADAVTEEERKALAEAVNSSANAISDEKIFTGLNFHIMTEAVSPKALSRAELESLVKQHGGKFFAHYTAAENMICVADRNLPKVASLVRHNTHSIIRPAWIFHCVEQVKIDKALGRPPLLLPFEPKLTFFVQKEKDGAMLADAVDLWHDSYARDFASVDELKEMLQQMPDNTEEKFDRDEFVQELADRGHDFTEEMTGWMFHRFVVYFDSDLKFVKEEEEDEDGKMEIDYEDKKKAIRPPVLSTELELARNIVLFGRGRVSWDLSDLSITHIVVDPEEKGRSQRMKDTIKSRGKIPHIVRVNWIQESWKEKTLLDEESKSIAIVGKDANANSSRYASLER